MSTNSRPTTYCALKILLRLCFSTQLSSCTLMWLISWANFFSFSRRVRLSSWLRPAGSWASGSSSSCCFWAILVS